MKIVYMGTPDFAVPTLKHLLEEGHSIPLVVTQPDKPRDRGKKIQPTPVKALALELGIPVLQPEQIRGNQALLSAISACDPDLVVVVAYGRILPKELLALPKYGCINIHGSLLPRYRGAAPIQRAILEGEEETGVTLIYLSEGLDEGDMIASAATKIGRKSAGELHEELAEMGATLLLETLPGIQSGTAPRMRQDDGLATYAPVISKRDGHLDFSMTSEQIECRIRAMDPWPGAYAHYKDQPIKILAARIGPVQKDVGRQPGRIVSADENGLGVETGSGILFITGIQIPGKRAMGVSEYLRGNQIEIGHILR